MLRRSLLRFPAPRADESGTPCELSGRLRRQGAEEAGGNGRISDLSTGAEEPPHLQMADR